MRPIQPPVRLPHSRIDSNWLSAVRESRTQPRESKAGPTHSKKSGHAYNGPMHDVVVYSRKGCHLCDVVKETLTQVQRDADFQWHEVDIDVDLQLRQEYNDEVPVVFIDGRKAFKYRMDGREFLRALAGR